MRVEGYCRRHRVRADVANPAGDSEVRNFIPGGVWFLNKGDIHFFLNSQEPEFVVRCATAREVLL